MNKVRSKVILERQFIPKGTIFVNQGETGSTAYLIQSGSVRVFSEHGDNKIELAELGPGQIIGEIALITDGERKASVEAIEDCNLVVITRAIFQERLDQSDQMIKAIVEMLSKRILSANENILGAQGSVESLISTVQKAYDESLLAISEDRRDDFEGKVKPKLDQFLNTLRSFEFSLDTV